MMKFTSQLQKFLKTQSRQTQNSRKKLKVSAKPKTRFAENWSKKMLLYIRIFAIPRPKIFNFLMHHPNVLGEIAIAPTLPFWVSLVLVG